MNCPIVGDPLYGQAADRLYLHAESLQFQHPVNNQRIKVSSEIPF
jgi:tRNA pseudouridine32 synthase/23S rRNA pseudouridine746 synthase